MTETDTEANRATIRGAFEAWQAGAAPITDVFDPAMVWRIEGHSAASREYPDRQAFVEEVAGGLVVDGTAFYDSISFNELWSRVRP